MNEYIYTSSATTCNTHTEADKRLLTASQLADKFSVFSRTIYGDIRALEQAGVLVFLTSHNVIARQRLNK